MIESLHGGFRQQRHSDHLSTAEKNQTSITDNVPMKPWVEERQSPRATENIGHHAGSYNTSPRWTETTSAERRVGTLLINLGRIMVPVCPHGTNGKLEWPHQVHTLTHTSTPDNTMYKWSGSNGNF